MQSPNFPDGIDAATFLAEYWQKRPLLIRNAFPGFDCRLDPNDLGGLACEEGVEARLVLEKGGATPWAVRHGPFELEAFDALPPSHWTLLVQDVDKYMPEVAGLLGFFRFLPDWRLDDVMVSYAEDQGSVGPHVDDYDVFLYQAMGRRRWRIHQQPVSEADYVPGLALRILPEFETEQEWLLEPGDCLYLPPNVAHWGIAEGECVTCSVGFRTPTMQEMFGQWCDELIETRAPLTRYRDRPLRPQEAPGEILPAVIEDLRETFARYLEQDSEQLRRWFGRYISETKPNLQVMPNEQGEDLESFFARLRETEGLLRNGLSRMAFSRGGGEDSLFANGDEYTLPADQGGLLELMTRERKLDYDMLAPWIEQDACRELLHRLYLDGHLLLEAELEGGDDV